MTLPGGAALLALTISSAASATTPADVAEADRLFEAARALLADKRYTEACPLFAESLRLDAGGGTLLNLAICHQRQGKLATAWNEFREALSQAAVDGRTDRQRTATEHLAELAPLVPRVTFRWADGATPRDAVVWLDHDAQHPLGIGVAVPIDPGSHTLEVRAPGQFPGRLAFSVSASEQRTVELPALVAESQTVLSAPVAPRHAKGKKALPTGSNHDAPASGGTRRVAGYTVAGAGGVLLALGGYFGVRALVTKQKSADAGCSDESCPNTAARDEYRAARTFAHASTIGIGLGAVATGVGLYFALSGDSPAKSTRGAISVTPALSGAALAWQRSF